MLPQYLLRAEAPLVGFVASAHYIYRKRAERQLHAADRA